jgi:diguanylate cyclase (GGDEF)-like protein
VPPDGCFHNRSSPARAGTPRGRATCAEAHVKVQSWTPKIYAPLLLAHLGVLLFAGEDWILAASYACVLAMLAVTTLLCGWRLRLSVNHNTPLWSLLLGALLSQDIAFALLLADALHHPQGTLVALDPTFWFCLGSFWLIVAAAYSPLTPMRRWTTAIDGVLACAIVLLFYLMLHRLLASDQPQLAVARYVMWLFDGMGLFVALFAALRLVATRRADERRFHFVLAAFACVELVVPAIHNRFILASESWLPEWLLGWPFVVLGLLLCRRRTAWLPGYQPALRVRRTAASIAPLMLSLALCLLAFAQLGRDRPLAMGALILAVAAYGIRTTVLLGYHQAVEEQLRALRRELHHKSVRDDLTGLLNRAGFRQVLRRAWQNAVRTKRDFAIAVIDVDNFKSFNDTYGHLAGDDCLSLLGHTLRTEAGRQPGAVAARYGGEEFVILLSGLHAAGAEAVMQRLRQHVEALQIRHINSAHGVVTISAGLAVMPAGTSLASEKLLRAADEVLFEAKRAGRNRIYVAATDLATDTATPAATA